MKTFLQFLEHSKPKVNSPTNVREDYISGNIFQEGSLVEQISTGKTGTIMRRGANHLICLTDTGELFKPWINDTKQLE
jgi:hypothetical protein